MVPKTCSIPECEKKISARGWCSTHYSRWRIHGDPAVSLYVRGNDPARFWMKVNKTGRCWEWAAARNEDGYGYFNYRGKIRKAHRVAYELMRGEIPIGLDLDHRCRNHGCVNPSHLRPVTNKLNSEHRGVASNNNSGYRGVSFHKARSKWIAYATHNGQRHYAGYFDTASEANAAAVTLRNELFTHNDLDRKTA